MKNQKFTSKLLLYHLLLYFFVILAVVAAFYFWVVRDIEYRTKEDFSTLTEKASSQFDNLIYNMDKAALQIAANPNIVSWFGRIPKQSGDNYFTDNPVLASEIVQLLNSYNFKKDGNTRICLYNDYGDFVYSATTMTTSEGVQNFFESADFDAVQQHFSGNNVFSMLRKPGEDILNTSGLPSPEYFSVIRQIKDYFSGTQKNGYVEVQQSVEQLDEIFRDLGSACYAAVYDENGDIIYRSPSLKQNADAKHFFEQQTLVDAAEGLSAERGNYLFRYRSEEVPLNLLFFKESGAITGRLNQFIMFLIAVFVTVSVAAVMIERILINALSKPLRELSKSVQNVTIDNLHLELENSSDNDELRRLNYAFNKVLQHLKVAIDQRILSQTNELKAHLFALQSQMNPHFIYNTLAIINMEAQIAENEKTVQICQALCAMLKYSSSMGDGMATLEQEFSHANHYLQLMKQRYEDSFEYSIEMDACLKQVKVSKLMIQPICENCFKHAFGNIEDVRRIAVRALEKEGQWIVTVEDNGCGVTDEFLEKFEQFKRTLSFETMQKRISSSELGQLSLVNTCMRLYLIYGEHFIFTVENTGNGTIVTLGGSISC